MASVFSGLLPAPLMARRDKVFLNQVVFGPATREWAGGWDGTGVRGELVDAEALRRASSAEPVHAGTALLLQTAWLATSVGPPAAQDARRGLPQNLQVPPE